MKTINNNKNNAMHFAKYLGYFLYLSFIISCDDFVDVGAPKNELTGLSVFTDAQTAEAALTGIYSQMTEGFGGFANYRTTLLTGLYSDELDNYSSDPNMVAFYENSLNPNNYDLNNLWSEPYSYIYQANAIIEGLGNTEAIGADTKEQFIGEALFIRAFCHFYLANFFGDISYINTTNYIKNSTVLRQSQDEVYSHIIEDLKEAITLLPDFYVSNGRVRPNKYVVQALLARAYLYTEDWANAEQYASLVIEAKNLYELESDLNHVFLKNSNEAIWQLYPVISGLNTVEGFSFIFSGTPYSTALNKSVYENFENHDLRKSNWIGISNVGNNSYYYPYKYQIYFASELTEYCMVLRLAEQYLIRAEARTQLGNLSAAIKDLNVIRNRAGLDEFTNATNNTLLDTIYKERQRELFAEWGHRWFDLKRTGRANAILSTIKLNWQSTDVLFPIPQSELQNNPNLTQNPGY